MAVNGEVNPQNGNLETESEESFVVLSSPSLMENSLPDVAQQSSSTQLLFQPPSTLLNQNSSSFLTSSAISDLSPEEIQRKLEVLLEENYQLKETLHQNNLAMKRQFDTLVKWQEDVMNVHQSHKEKFEETKKLISNLRLENAELKKGLQNHNENSNLLQENEQLKLKLAQLENELIKKTDAEKSAELAIKNKDIATLRNIVREKDELLSRAQIKIVELEQKITNTSYVEAQSKGFNEMIDGLKAQLLMKDDVIQEKMSEIDKLNEELNTAKAENESIPILKAQVELYQSDFNAEREARTSLAREKEIIAEDLRHLQRRNQSLLEEVGRSQPGTGSMPEDISEFEFEVRGVPKYRCWRCGFSFFDPQALENHVYRCIDLDSLP